MSPPVQELPAAYSFVRLCCLPLHGRRGHVISPAVTIHTELTKKHPMKAEMGRFSWDAVFFSLFEDAVAVFEGEDAQNAFVNACLGQLAVLDRRKHRTGCLV